MKSTTRIIPEILNQAQTVAKLIIAMGTVIVADAILQNPIKMDGGTVMVIGVEIKNPAAL